MIHLNLIDAAERLSTVETVAPVHVTSIAERNKKSRNKLLTAAVAAIFAVVGFSCFLSVNGVPDPLQGLFPASYLNLIGAEDPSLTEVRSETGMRTSAGGSLENQALNAAAYARQREAMTAKQIVGEINPQVLYKKSRTDYSSYLPLEKQSYQKASFGQFIAFLNTATPDDVGFTDCIYKAPNFFYVRGAAVKPTSQRSFLERMKSVSSNFKTPPLPENAPATDITAYGQYNVNNVKLNSVTQFVPSAEVAVEVKNLKTMASNVKVPLAGFEKPVIEDFGVYKRYAFNVTSSADFSDLQAFFAAYTASNARVGIQQIEMKHAKKDLVSSMRFEMYVVP